MHFDQREKRISKCIETATNDMVFCKKTNRLKTISKQKKWSKIDLFRHYFQFDAKGAHPSMSRIHTVPISMQPCFFLLTGFFLKNKGREESNYETVVRTTVSRNKRRKERNVTTILWYGPQSHGTKQTKNKETSRRRVMQICMCMQALHALLRAMPACVQRQLLPAVDFATGCRITAVCNS